ncbi:methyltransferase [Pullulanibacillus camelliae]|uniref:Methyltransferase n=1 Tax=Pullulanibacillus camelliae TaxID=1707096 RepID=A0A8J2VLA7_9BACL|nr:site-specific DNA-methyltransferase [Pullulanibacillus camelliae]GGE35777.1 methyltransferase [Pullulanibacillus camelliae]
MMLKVSQDQRRRLRNLDYREILNYNEEEAALIIADPPYNLDLEDWDKDFDFEELMWIISTALKPDGSALIFNILPNVLEMYRHAETYRLFVQDLMVWVKPSFPQRYLRKRGYVNKNREYILWVSKSKTPPFQLKPDEAYHNGVFDYPSLSSSSKEKVFPYQKPKALIEDLILRHSQPFDLVIDLFSGSGIVAKCCKQWNRRYLGYEMDKETFDRIELD